MRGAVPAVLGLVVLAVAGIALGRAVHQHPYFAVREVVVRGAFRLPADLIRRVAGISPGMNVWNVDGARAAAALEHQPWIRYARVHRELPHRVVITVREERPVAILATTDRTSAFYYLGGHGSLFAALGSKDTRDLPYVTGLAAADLEAPDGFGPRALRRALALLRLAAPLGPISEIHVDRAQGLTLLPVAPRVSIEVGWTDFAPRLARLPTVLARWAGREDEIKTVRAVFEDEVIVRLRKPLAARAPRRGARA